MNKKLKQENQCKLIGLNEKSNLTSSDVKSMFDSLRILIEIDQLSQYNYIYLIASWMNHSQIDKKDAQQLLKDVSAIFESESNYDYTNNIIDLFKKVSYQVKDYFKNYLYTDFNVEKFGKKIFDNLEFKEVIYPDKEFEKQFKALKQQKAGDKCFVLLIKKMSVVDITKNNAKIEFKVKTSDGKVDKELSAETQIIFN